MTDSAVATGEVTLSVVVCTRNRATRLRRALESLLRQAPPPNWEIVVVDNGSTDETPAVIREFAARGPVRYVQEPLPGLDRARNRGIAVARGRLLAFTDDDVVVHPDWAPRIVARFDAHAEIDAVFGYTYADSDVPEMFSLRTRPRACLIAGKGQVWESTGGNNMAFRRAVVDRIGPFDPLLDVGAKYPGAGDGEFQYRFFKAGLKAFYDPDIRVKHEPDIAGRSAAAEILKADAGIAAWYGKHAAHGDLYAARLFAVHLGRNVCGLRSLVAALGRGDGAALRLRARRLATLLRAFALRGLEEFRSGDRPGGARS